MPSLLLVAAVAALAAGPLTARALARRPGALLLLDGFVLTTIVGLVLLEVLPVAVQRGDVWVALALVAGLLLPTVAERLFHFAARQAHGAVLVAAMAGIAVHSLLDGSALAQSDATPSSLLGLGVILHQFPVGLTVWWVLRDQRRTVPWLVLLLMAVATVAGYLLQPNLAALEGSEASAWLTALIGGSLLHVVAHPAAAHGPGHAAPARSGSRWLEATGAFLGLALLVSLVASGRLAHARAPLAAVGDRLVALLVDSAPALVLAYLAAGLLHAFFPRRSIAWLGRGRPITQAWRGMALGLPLPVCSCGVVPLYQSLIRNGAPPAAAIAFLVATPELGVDAVLLSLPLLGAGFATLRVVAAAAVALLVAILVARVTPRPRRGLSVLEEGAPAGSVGSRLALAVRTGFGEVLDHTAPWVLLGLVAAAFVQPLLDAAWLRALPWWIEIPVFALVGMPVYVCASAATPFVAVLVAGGVSPGAGLAFLLTGPATNVTTFGLLARLHDRRTAATFAALMFALPVTCGVLVERLLPGLATPALRVLTEEPASPLAMGSIAVLAVAVAASIGRRGMRAFLGELRLETPRGEGGGGHAHDHGHDHTHGGSCAHAH